VEQPKVVKLPKAKLPKAVKLPKAKLPKVVKLPKEEKAKLSIEIKKLEYLYSGSDRDDLEKAIKIDLNYTKDEELIYNNQSSCNKQIFLLKHTYQPKPVGDKLLIYNNNMENFKEWVKCPYKHFDELLKFQDEFTMEISKEAKLHFSEVFTNGDFVEGMLDKYDSNIWLDPTQTWLECSNGIGNFALRIARRHFVGLENIIENEEERWAHIINNMIYVCDILARNMYMWLTIIDFNKSNNPKFYTGDFLLNEFDLCMQNVWKKSSFNNTISNPPFNQMIDLAFMKKAYLISDTVMFVHPSTWLLDEKGRQNKFINAKELVKDHIESIELFNGNKIFGIGLFVPCVITYINKNKKIDGISCIDTINNINLTYDNIGDINKYSNVDVYFGLKNKIYEKVKSNNLHEILKKDQGSNFYVNLSQIRGHVDLSSDTKMVKDDFYTLCVKNIQPETSPRVQREKTQASFKTIEEANNFINYVKTDFVRFCLSVYKNNQNLYCGEMELIPWLDFTKEWTDKILALVFDLSKEERDFITKNIPKYY
jgi:hypothetical protein